MDKSDKILAWALVIGVGVSLWDHDVSWLMIALAFWLGYIYDRKHE